MAVSRAISAAAKRLGVSSLKLPLLWFLDGKVELEDALACDDEVLEETFQFIDPPLNTVIRVPQMFVAQLRHSLGWMLHLVHDYSIPVYYWTHRQFADAVAKRYLRTYIEHFIYDPRSTVPLPSARQRPSYGDCLKVKREYYQNSSVLDCVTQCSQFAAHLCEQFLQVKQIGFVTLRPLRCG